MPVAVETPGMGDAEANRAFLLSDERVRCSRVLSQRIRTSLVIFKTGGRQSSRVTGGFDPACFRHFDFHGLVEKAQNFARVLNHSDAAAIPTCADPQVG